MSRRVLWVIKGLGPGGAERLLAEAAVALADDDDLALTCVYVMPAKQHLVPRLQAAGVTCVCVGRGPHDPWWPARLARFVRRGRFDVVHVHSPLPGSIARLAARSLPQRRRPTMLTTEHNAWGTYRLPTRVLNRITSRWDAHTFAVSGEVASSVRGSAAAAVSVLTHGIDVVEVRAHRRERDRMRLQLGVPGRTVLVGTVANFREQKNYPTLLRACALLVERGVPFVLVAAGQGPLEAETRELHARLGLGERVRLLGYRADAVDVLAACDVFVLASAFEGLPVVLMESCALGLPAVLTDVGGMRAALGDDAACWVAPGEPSALADALESVVTDEARRQLLGTAAAAAATTFDGAGSVAALRRWYLTGGPVIAVARVPVGVSMRAATDADLPAILQLCSDALGWDHSGDWAGLYRWKHFDNPFGRSPAWVAVVPGEHGERVVGLRAFLRWELRHGNEVVHAVRAVDTAVDPEFRGRGLFTALTLHALPSLRADGVSMVFNTPNAQSLPGYSKMGWQQVGRVRPVVRPVGARSVVRLLRSRVPATLWPEPLTIGRSVEEWLATDAALAFAMPKRAGGLCTQVDEAFAHWRFASSVQPCRVVGSGSTTAVVQLRARGKARELVCLTAWGSGREVDRLLVGAARAAGADVVVRLGDAAVRRGFVGVGPLGPPLMCLMLADAAPTPMAQWHLTMSDVALF